MPLWWTTIFASIKLNRQLITRQRVLLLICIYKLLADEGEISSGILSEIDRSLSVPILYVLGSFDEGDALPTLIYLA